jgi:hypothetical protein
MAEPFLARTCSEMSGLFVPKTPDISEQLPPEEESDPETQSTWAQEIERRAQEARAGSPAAGDWDTVCNEIEAELP